MNRYSLALKKHPPKKKSKTEKKLDKIANELKKLKKEKDPYHKLRQDIKRIIEGHSGGMKLTELIPELFSEGRKLNVDTVTLMHVIHTDEDLRVLEYTWRGNGASKFFIYTP